MDEAAAADLEETKALELESRDLDRAITSLLHAHDPSANAWLTAFAALPRAWSVSLYLAFPPPGSSAGVSPDVRFFALNLLLSKIRSHKSQLTPEEAQEIYETLIRQLPLNLENPQVGARLCLVVSGAAALAGADTCYDLVELITTGGADPGLSVELLIGVAEETLHRITALPWEVGECMQNCSPEVLEYLQGITMTSRVIVCLERWIRSGVVLSEFHMQNASLLRALLEALGSPDEATFGAAVGALLELIRAVDHLPGRDEAMRVVISGVLAQKEAALSPPRAQGLLSLVSVICLSEPYLLARGGQECEQILQWLVIGMGGVLGLSGASVAAEAWPRVVSVPKPKRSSFLQSPFFAAGTQAILQSCTYPESFHIWEDSNLEKDEFFMFREGLAKDALVACFSELNFALLAYIIEQFRGAKRWQDAEVCLYAAVALKKEIISSEYKSFFFSLLEGLPGRAAVTERDFTSLPHLRLVETTARLLESYSDLAAADLSALQLSLGYCLGALHIPDVRPAAASAFKELCRGGAGAVAAAGMLPALMSACEHAISSVGTFKRASESNDLLAVIGGLTQVAAALPLEEAKLALISLTGSAVSTIKALAGVMDGVDEKGPVLAEALRVVAVAVGGGGAGVGVVLQEIWEAVKVVSSVWAVNGEVSSAVGELRSVVAEKVGREW